MATAGGWGELLGQRHAAMAPDGLTLTHNSKELQRKLVCGGNWSKCQEEESRQKRTEKVCSMAPFWPCLYSLKKLVHLLPLVSMSLFWAEIN